MISLKTKWMAVAIATLMIAACAPQQSSLEQVGFTSEDAKILSDAWEDCEVSDSEVAEMEELVKSYWEDEHGLGYQLGQAIVDPTQFLTTETALQYSAAELWELMIAKCRDSHEEFIDLLAEAKALVDLIIKYEEVQPEQELGEEIKSRLVKFNEDMIGVDHDLD